MLNPHMNSNALASKGKSKENVLSINTEERLSYLSKKSYKKTLSFQIFYLEKYILFSS